VRVSSRAASWGWLGAGMWLVFLTFPLLSILADDANSVVVKVTSAVLIAAFAVVYSVAFHRLSAFETRLYAGIEPGPEVDGGMVPFAVLVGINVALFALVDLPSLGVLPFIVAFAAFHFTLRSALIVFVLSLAGAILIPLAYGALGDVWFLALIVLSVGGGTLLLRRFEEYQLDQSTLRTRLAVSDERSRMARDVHDVLGHSLTAVILKAELSHRLLEGIELDGSNDERDRQRLDATRAQLLELTDVSRSALAEIRSTVGGLRAANLPDEIAVARSVLSDAGVDLLVTGEVTDIADQHRTMLAWVVREAITNVVRHAEASRCHIELAPAASESHEILLRVTDNGVGFDDHGDGNGLRGLRERVEAAGAVLSVRSADGVSLEVMV